MGVGDSWGTREELLHPRDSKGRFRSTWKMASGVVDKIMSTLASFNPRTFTSDEEAQAWVHSVAKGDRHLANRKASIDAFLRGFSQVNQKLEAGDTSGPEVREIDAAMRPLQSDLILTRTMTPESFGLNAANIGQIEELTGKLISSKGYTSVGIGTPYQRQPGTITMTIATPKGTDAVVPNLSRPSKEIILGRGQALRVTKVEPDGTGGWNVLAVASSDHADGEAPVDIARAVPGDDVPEAAPQAPGTPAPGAPAQAPGGPAPVAPAAAPVRTGRPGRPAGPPPAPRNDGHVADSVGTGQAPEPPSAQVPTPEPAPDLPAAPEAGPDARSTFRTAFDEADLKVPTVGTRRKQFMDAYNGVASGKKTPQEAVSDLDNAISINRKIIASDEADGTDSGPLPEDVKRQEALSDLIKEHFNFTGRKQFKESGGKAAAPAAKKAAPAPVAPKAAAPEKKPEPERLIPGMAPGKTNAGRVQVGEKILVNQNKQGEWVPATRKTGATTITVTSKSNTQGRAGLRRQAPQRTIIKGTDENGNEISIKSAPSHQTFWTAKEKPSKEKATSTPKKATAEADAEIARIERERKAQIRREMRAEREARGETPTKAAPAKVVEPSATEKARTETIARSLERASEPKKAVPPPARPSIPARDLSDKGLMQRFEAEIKKDNPDEARLKELGDELDRRDLETKNRVRGLSDQDLEKKFQDEIRKNSPDEEEMRRLGDELDRRDAERAAKERKIEDLVSKGRDYRDAWAEVNGKDPDLLDMEERKSLLDQSRRAGESRETTLRRLYQEHVHRQFLDAERVTRGHLLTPEGRAKGIDAKTLFQGSNVNANRYASDELKEYWETHPRKTFLQYKADTLGRREDVAAAKKTEGVARDLELGEKLKRKSPQKKAIPAPVKEEKAPEVPATPKTGPKNIKEMLESPAVSAETKKVIQDALADTEIPAGRPDIDKMTIPQLREEAKLQGKKIPSSARRKADIVAFLKGEPSERDLQFKKDAEAIRSTPLKESTAIGSLDDARAKLNKSTIANLRKAAEGQGIDVPRSARLKKDVVEAIIRGMAQKELDKRRGGAPEVKAPEVPEAPKGASKPEWGTLKTHGFKNGDIVVWYGQDRKVPKAEGRRGRIQFEPIGWALKDLETGKTIHSGGFAHRSWFGPDTEVPKTETPPAAPASGVPGDIDRMTIPQLRDEAKRQNRRIPSNVTRKADIVEFLKGDDNKVQSKAIRESAAKPSGAEIKARFDRMTSSEDGENLLDSYNFTRPELVQIAKDMNIVHAGRATKQEIKDQILHWGLRRRLQSEAVATPGPTGGSRVLKNAMERKGPKRSAKPKIENNWGVPGGEVNFHEDGNIGGTIHDLGRTGDADLEVNGDRLDNTLGKAATQLVQGDITQQDLIDKLRSMSVQLDGNGSPEAARLLRRAADRMDSPHVKRPELPEGTPEPIGLLMERLLATPLARSSGSGGRDNEIQALAKLMDDWRDEKITPTRLPMAVREATFNRRHESNEGKFQIDRAVNEAVQSIEEMGRKDRDSLRPPSQRKAHVEQPLPQRVPREALKNDLADASMPELRAVAQSEGVTVPGTLRSKKEVAGYLNEVRAEKSKLNTVPELKGQSETLDRIRVLKEAMRDEPDSRVAPSWGDAPSMIILNAVEGLQDGSLDNPMVSRMLADIDGFVPKDSPLRKLIKDARGDLDDIYINAQGGGGNIGPEKYHVGSTQGVEDLIRDVTPEVLADPKTKRERISTGQVGANAKVTLPNGKTVFEKTSKRVGWRSGESSSDAEQLLPAIGASLGAPTMPTMRMSPDTIYTDWVQDYTPGQNIISDISDTPNAGMEEIWDRLKNSREGKILGLLDMITFNGDRHGSNWGIDGDGKLIAIDNGMGWGFTDFEEISPGVDLMKIDLEENVFPNLADRFSMLGFFNEDTDGLMNPHFTVADMEKVRARLEALRDQFRHLDREQWLDLSLKAVDILKRYATGTEDMFE